MDQIATHVVRGVRASCSAGTGNVNTELLPRVAAVVIVMLASPGAGWLHVSQYSHTEPRRTAGARQQQQLASRTGIDASTSMLLLNSATDAARVTSFSAGRRYLFLVPLDGSQHVVSGHSGRVLRANSSYGKCWCRWWGWVWLPGTSQRQ